MSVSNFELDITSRVAAGDEGGEAPPGLVWQPTLTLWQRGENAAIVRDSQRHRWTRRSLPTRLTGPAQSPDETAQVASDTSQPSSNSRTEQTRNGHAKSDLAQDLARRQFAGADILGYALFQSVGRGHLVPPALGGIGRQILWLLAFSPRWSRSISPAPWYFSAPSGGRRSAIRTKGAQHFGAASRAAHR